MKHLSKLFQAVVLCLSVSLLVPGVIHAQKRTLTAHASTPIDDKIGGFYTSLPASYNTGSKSYPLLIFVHGIGEIGAGDAASLPAVLKNGPPMQINSEVNSGKDANFPDPVVVNGKSYEFIVVSPQFNQWPSWAGEVDAMNDLIDYCEKNYRVDASKIYMTGLSMGGGITWDCAGSTSNNRLAGVVVVAGASAPSAGAVGQLVKEHLPVWATHNLNDPTVAESNTTGWVSQINAAGANPQALMTIFNASGHGGWLQTYGAPGTPGITNSSGQNVYQWMLQYKRSGDNVVLDNGSTTQAPPTVSAGTNQTITLPAASGTSAAATSTSTTLTGSASTSGSIASYQWTQVSGPNTATFGNAKAASSSVAGLIQGTYVFKLTATDNVGQSASAQVTVTVNAAAVTTVFTVNAGADVTITLPTNSAKLTGAATVKGVTLATTSWKQVSGPNTASITNGGTITPTMGNLVAGTYVFQVTITSTSGGTTSDQMTLKVNPATVFTVSAGPDVTITLPTNSAKLTGAATVQGVTLATTSWKQVSGPNTASITNGGTISPTMGNLVAGTYVFQVTITSTSGGTTSDQMTLKVNSATVFTVNAGPDVTVTLPATSVKISGATATVKGVTLASSKWTQVSGPNTAGITNSGTISPTISNLVAGTYVFKITITSTSGGTTSDQMTLTVNAGAVATVFTANAGPDIFITLPTNSWKIVGTCVVKGVTVATCKWKQVSGPSMAAISGGGSVSPVVSNLIAGTYVFEVDITSTTGLVTSDQMTLKVNPASTSSSGNATATNGLNLADSSASISNLTLYPNPVSVGQQVTVEGSGVKTGTIMISIYDISGRLAKQQAVENTSATYFHQSISTSGLVSGTYILSLSSGSATLKQFKLVVQ
ncbi:MAG TPA: T9SS type A sorting domain-containing protein [Puia sp.]|nr:T9SS type A sorting domain-containing protein [Puia sp.]